jgi:hypothetical protein
MRCGARALVYAGDFSSLRERFEVQVRRRGDGFAPAYTRAYTVRGDLCVGALHKAIAVMVVVVVMIIVR